MEVLVSTACMTRVMLSLLHGENLLLLGLSPIVALANMIKLPSLDPEAPVP